MKELKQTFRDVRMFGFMIAFPIVFILVLGLALSNAFNTNKITIDDIHVLYKNQGNNQLARSFEAFKKELSKSGIHFKEATGNVNGKKEVKQNNVDGYVEISNTGVKLYESERNSIEGNIIQGMMSAFVDKYNVAMAVAKIDSSKVSTVLASNHTIPYINETSLHAAKSPGAMDYYAIAMTAMIAFYAALNGTSLMNVEIARKTGDRLLVSPARKSDIFLGKVFGSIVVNFIFIVIVVLFSKFVFKANWGDHLGTVLLVLFTEILMSISFGLGVSYLTKTAGAARTIVMIIIQVASFIGGAYYKIDYAGNIPKLSPLSWAIEGITKVIYENDLAAAIPSITLNLGITIITMLIAVVSFRRREGL
nr:ABC transporter permease [Bacillus sp. FJAT-49736]